jgi:hypothetical protein
MMTTLALFRNKVLRSAIERNLVSFPAQIPVFAKAHSGDMQTRIVQLYFLGGWTIRRIATRYNLTGEMVRKSLTDWRVRAISSGYIQEIGPEVLPALVSTSDTPEDFDDEAADQVLSEQPVRRLPQVVAIQAPQVRERTNVLGMLLEELEAVASRPWEAFCTRLLHILKRECIQSDLSLSTAQAERIEAAIDVRADQSQDLLRDLRNRITDERRCTAVANDQGPARAALLHILLAEIETTISERQHEAWPRHCLRFLTVVGEGCAELGLEFSLAQVKRIESALADDPHRLGDLLRDLRNRMADEQEHTAPIRVPDRVPRQLTAGSYR